MRVEIRILSGSRRNECVELDTDLFTVGGEPGSDVFFDPVKEPAVLGVRVQIRGEEDGWRIRRLAGEGLLVNQKWLETDLPIRSGDVLRLSPAGPDLRFGILPARETGPSRGRGAVVQETAAAVAASPSAAPQPEPPSPSAAPQPASIEPAGGCPNFRVNENGTVPFDATPATAPTAAVAAAAPQPVAAPAAPGAAGRSQWLAAVVMMALVAVLLVLAFRPYLDRLGDRKDVADKPQGTLPGATKEPGSQPSVNTSQPPLTPAAAAVKDLRPPVKDPEPGDQPREPAVKPEKPGPKEDPTPAEPAAGPPTPLAILAIESKEKGELQPFAVACAVEHEGRQMLLTTGRIALIMAKFDGAYYAIVPGGPAAKPRVVEINPNGIHLYVLYVNSLERNNREGAQYFDVAVLTFRGKLPAGALGTVASRELMSRIRVGTALECWTTPRPRDIPQASAVVREDLPDVRKTAVEVTKEIRLAEETDDEPPAEVRRLLELSGLGDDFAEGSPVLDARGQVAALCTQPVPRANAGGNGAKAVRAALIDAEMLTALWTGRPSKQWFVYDRGKDRPAK